MFEEKKQILKLKSKELLLTLASLTEVFSFERKVKGVSIVKIVGDREVKREELLDRIKYLEKKNLVKKFVEGKNYYIEITDRGKKRAIDLTLDMITLERTPIWDKKWRVIFFDVPRKYNKERDILRKKLIQLGFGRIQESVYCYPFECSEEIKRICKFLGINKYCSIMIADIMIGEVNIVLDFLNSGVLTKEDLKLWKPKGKY